MLPLESVIRSSTSPPSSEDGRANRRARPAREYIMYISAPGTRERRQRPRGMHILPPLLLPTIVLGLQPVPRIRSTGSAAVAQPAVAMQNKDISTTNLDNLIKEAKRTRDGILAVTRENILGDAVLGESKFAELLRGVLPPPPPSEQDLQEENARLLRDAVRLKGVGEAPSQPPPPPARSGWWRLLEAAAFTLCVALFVSNSVTISVDSVVVTARAQRLAASLGRAVSSAWAAAAAAIPLSMPLSASVPASVAPLGAGLQQSLQQSLQSMRCGLHGLSHGLQCLGASAPVQGAVQVAQPALQGLLQRRFLCGVAVGILIEAWWFRRTDR